jgi:prepilin-type processing-associated H-X9-DG protein
MTMAHRRGGSFADLVVAILMLAMLAICVAPMTAYRARETANRVKCSSNLRQIGQAILLYANDNKGEYPRTRYDVDANVVNAYTHPNATNPFAEDGPATNDVTAVLYLLLRTQDLTPGVFICPSGDAAQWNFPAAKEDYSNFIDSRNLSYSIAVPYPTPQAVKDGWKWNQTMLSDFAVAADMNPGSPEVMQLNLSSPAALTHKANSLNHAGTGENVLYADGHVEFKQTPLCGHWQDNVYTYGISGNYMDASGVQSDRGAGTGIVGRPAHPTDSVLLPTAAQGQPTAARLAEYPMTPRPPDPMIASPESANLAAIIVIALCAVGVIVFGLRGRKRNPPAPPEA